MEDLALLLREDLSLGSLGEDLSLALPLAAASVLEAVLVVVLALVVAEAISPQQLAKASEAGTPAACMDGLGHLVSY